MKTMIRLVVVCFMALAFGSCRKTVVVPENPLAGSWYISSVAETDGYNWQPVVTGLENGIFDFYDNGAAQYTDGSTGMQGVWFIHTLSGGYYDQYGNYYTDVHQSLDIQLEDPYTHGSIHLYFDDVQLYGNRFYATYYNGRTIERFTFIRY